MMISFIIPVYNVKNYVSECIESITSQITNDFEVEIILVDDGSTDGSGVLCDNFAQRYKNIIVLHKENGGVSSARNLGMQYATGKYIAFVDADDIIEKNSVCKVIEWISSTDVDVCFMQGMKFYEDASEIYLDEPLLRERVQNKSAVEVIDYLSTQSKYPGSACTKLFRREFIEQYDIFFPCGRQHGEDLNFVRKALLNAKTFDVLSFTYYKYRQNRKDSSTHSLNDKSFFEYFQFIKESIEDCSACEDKKGRYFMSFVAYEYLILLWMVGLISNKEKKEAYALLVEYRWVLKLSRVNSVYITYYLCRIFGLRITSTILAIYKKIHK